MSYEAVWGFDPEKALEAQKQLQNAHGEDASAEGCDSEQGAEDVRIAGGLIKQIYELRRLFRL